MSVTALLYAYLKYLKENQIVKESSLAKYRSAVKRLSSHFENRPANTITQADIARYYRDRGTTSVFLEVSLLSSAYNWGLTEGLSFNPCIGVKHKQQRPVRSRLLSEQEYSLLYGWARENHPRLRVILDLAYMTGLRVSDLRLLKKSDFNITQTKTGGKLQYEVTPDLQAVLAEAKEIEGFKPSEYVLSSASGMPLARNTISGWFKRACKAVGIKDACLHDLRALAATDAYKQGGTEAAKALLGHSSTITTLRYIRSKEVVRVKPLSRKSRQSLVSQGGGEPFHFRQKINDLQ